MEGGVHRTNPINPINPINLTTTTTNKTPLSSSTILHPPPPRHQDGAVQLFAKLKHSGFRRIQDLNLSYNDIDGQLNGSYAVLYGVMVWYTLT